MEKPRTDEPIDPAARLFALMLGVFFGGGLLASIEALLVPRLKLTSGMGFAQAMLVQLIYYAGYLLFAWPAAAATARVGAMRASASGLAAIALGCGLCAATGLRPAMFPLLAALTLISAGVTTLQIACNGVMATHGGQRRGASRLTLLQGFNALGTVIGPLIGAEVLLGHRPRLSPETLFAVLAMGFGTLAVAFAAHRGLLPVTGASGLPTPARLGRLIRQPRMASGSAAIFAYVGAEVTIGTLAVSYLMLPDRLDASPVTAGRLVSLFWGGAMIGRFVGAWALTRVGAARLLAGAAIGAAAMLALAMAAHGVMGSAALLAIGLCNSIMFPTIYALAMPDAAADMPAAAMLLCVAVVGGAVVPMLAGAIADRSTLIGGLALPALCYAGIAAFARGAQARAA